MLAPSADKGGKNMDEGMNHLARVLHGRIKENSDARSDLVLDFGVIQNDYSLLTNTYPIAIPKADYLVLRQLTLGNTGDVLTKTQYSGSHAHSLMNLDCSDGGSVTGTVGASGEQADGSHQHNVLIPEKMRWIKPGDRVLVAWVQHDAVVLDIIKNATDIG